MGAPAWAAVSTLPDSALWRKISSYELIIGKHMVQKRKHLWGLALPAPFTRQAIRGAVGMLWGVILGAAAAAPGGVPLSDLTPDSPERYSVKSGDTLRSIASLYIREPWRWAQLWDRPDEPAGHPPLLHAGQLLVLERQGERAYLRIERAQPLGDTLPGLRLSPRLRARLLPEPALPTLEPHLIEPFLAEPLIVDEQALEQAPRIVAAPEGRVLITRGDRAYARGSIGSPLEASAGAAFRIFRQAQARRDPTTGTILGYEARYVGEARLLQPQTPRDATAYRTPGDTLPVPAVLDIVSARSEIRVGDRLLSPPPRLFMSYAPQAPQASFAGGRVASMYGDAVGVAGQNQVVVINKGTADGLASGHVLALVKSGTQVADRTVTGGPEQIQLPDQRNGLIMVFRPFDKLSYALVLESRDGVMVGDYVVHPR